GAQRNFPGTEYHLRFASGSSAILYLEEAKDGKVRKVTIDVFSPPPSRKRKNLQLPDTFTSGNSNTTALSLRATTVDPHLSFENATPPVSRTDTYSWDLRNGR